ncbi:hypothetical protein F4677DRAFT_152319 [Hypoxylon crocopeplum]|nr:hypothetical protein F4677DRAFT_152319 [Hypoxylon crocopeplum]
MSADLFAAFEDVSKSPPPERQPPTSFSHPSTLASDPFSFGVNNVTGTGTQLRSSQMQNTQQPTGGNGWKGASFPSIQSGVEAEEDDGWGDFEVAPTPTATSALGASPLGPTRKESQNPVLQRTRIVRASTLDLMTNNLVDLDNSTVAQDEAKRPSWTHGPYKQVKAPTPRAASSRPPKRTSNANSNVLFDADDFDREQNEDEDEDFGEFETVASPVQAAPDLLSTDVHSPSVNTGTRTSQLLSGLNLTESVSYPQAPRSPSFQDRNPFPGLVVAPPPKKEKQSTNEPITSPTTAWPSIDPKESAGSDRLGDDWGSFDDFPVKKTRSSTKKTESNWDWDSAEATQPKPTSTQAPIVASTPKDSSWDWDPVDTQTQKNADPGQDNLPPTNIPPPSILLSVFPQLFEEANTSLYKPISGQSFSVKNRILSDPKTIEFLRGYLALATVAARIIAGRKLRWHRDKFLTQRMTISAAGSKGMKLAGVDKAQAAREDRESADVVAQWKDHIGRLRSAVAAANSSMKNNVEQLKIPEISESMHIQTEKAAPTAPKGCIVCGLKRNERVSKVDYEVEDSFGEWWVDHWGHLACKRFWLQHENALRQR